MNEPKFLINSTRGPSIDKETLDKRSLKKQIRLLKDELKDIDRKAKSAQAELDSLPKQDLSVQDRLWQR